uniref:Uncharacterized protein n=1 Tax=Zooxanthella nutricula TaxID=1333877 RepID=A0A7S2KXN9_9DINO
MAAVACGTAFLVSFALIGIGLVTPVTELTCGWVKPAALPFFLQLAVYAGQAEDATVCLDLDAPDTAGLLPVSSFLVAGCFGATIAALNTLPLGKSDGSAIARAAPPAKVQDTLLPWGAFIFLCLTVFETQSSALFPAVLEYLLFTYGLKPLLVTDPVFCDNASKPLDPPRRFAAFWLYFFAFGLLLPSFFVK